MVAPARPLASARAARGVLAAARRLSRYVFAFGLTACSQTGTTVAATAPDAAPDAGPQGWHVAGGFLRDAAGRAMIVRGANVSGKNKTPPWFDFQGPSDFARMRVDWGMNGVRFLVEWAAIEPEEGQYDEAYLDAVAQRIEWAEEADLYVVVDMHEDVYGEGFASGGGDGAPAWTCDSYAGFTPTTPWAIEALEPQVTACVDQFWHSTELQAHYAEAWRRVAERLSGFDHVVGFDVMNEPFWGTAPILTFEPTLLEPFYEMVVPIVRTAAPGWVAFIEPSSSRNLGGTTHLVPPSFANYVYAPHSYDTGAESGNGFNPMDAPGIESNIAALAAEAQMLGAALWLGEYGDTDTDPQIAAYMGATCAATGAVAAGSTYWDYTMGGYGMLDVDGGEAQPLVSTIVQPYAERVAGDPLGWTWDAATATFTLTYHPNASIVAPTLVSIPSRLYPAGYTFECGGCTAKSQGGELVVTAPPSADPAVLTVHP
jgi:endoglycosylceramidase